MQEKIEKKKNFFARFKKGILDMTVEQQLKCKLVGIVGGIVGLVLALISLLYSRMWGFSIFVFFVIWLQAISYIGTRKQLISTREMMKDIETDESRKGGEV